MKAIIVIISMLFSLISGTQKGSAIYAFKQDQSSGIRPAEVDQWGNIRTVKKDKETRYMLFLKIPGKAKQEIQVTGLWINGQQYDFNVAMQKTPVLLNTGLSMPGQKDSVLIPATNDPVYQIFPKEKSVVTSKAKRNKGKAISVSYKLNGNHYQLSTDKIEKLPVLVNE